MPVATYRFIAPHILAAIADLQLIAKTVVDGFMLGVHQSPKSGVGLEFNQYRSYQPGDDLRRVDWKMFARSDRYFVRESEVETSISVRFVLDATASMAHEENALSKFDYARFLIASLAYLADGQGDAIGLIAVNNANIVELPPRRSHQHLHRFLHELENLDPAGSWPAFDSLEKTLLSSQQRQIVVFVSDVHEQDDEIQRVLADLSSLKNEVLLFHIMGQDELTFGYKGAIAFEDLESGDVVQVDTDKDRSKTVEALQNRVRFLEQKLRDQHITYELLTLQQPLDFALRNYFKQRLRN